MKTKLTAVQGLLILVTFPLLIVLNGYIFATEWRWFLVEPLGVPSLRIVDAIGISFMVGTLLYQKKRQDDREDALKSYITAVCTMLVMFGMAAIIHLFQ